MNAHMKKQYIYLVSTWEERTEPGEIERKNYIVWNIDKLKDLAAKITNVGG